MFKFCSSLHKNKSVKSTLTGTFDVNTNSQFVIISDFNDYNISTMKASQEKESFRATLPFSLQQIIWKCAKMVIYIIMLIDS